MLEDRRFYVYMYFDPRRQNKYKYGKYEFNYEPFYVGAGKHNRCYHHIWDSLKGKQSFKCHKIRKIINETGKEPIIIKYEEHLTFKEARYLEIKMIKIIGRFDLNKGPLTNKTDGGEGSYNIVVSKQTRTKISKANKGKKKPDGFGKIVGKSNSSRIVLNKTRKKISVSLKGRKLTLEHRRNITNSLTGKKHSNKTKIKIGKSNIGKHSKPKTIFAIFEKNNWICSCFGHIGIKEWCIHNAEKTKYRKLFDRKTRRIFNGKYKYIKIGKIRNENYIIEYSRNLFS